MIATPSDLSLSEEGEQLLDLAAGERGCWLIEDEDADVAGNCLDDLGELALARPKGRPTRAFGLMSTPSVPKSSRARRAAVLSSMKSERRPWPHC